MRMSSSRRKLCQDCIEAADSLGDNSLRIALVSERQAAASGCSEMLRAAGQGNIPFLSLLQLDRGRTHLLEVSYCRERRWSKISYEQPSPQ